MKTKSAFSLIELSIVLIIIGLLVAGITGGASLIESAKQRAFLNETESYKNAVFIFRAMNDRLPSDTNENGLFGNCMLSPCESDTYTKTTFPGYDTIVPDYNSAPFIDLYLSGVIDFKPSTTTNAEGLGFPVSKILKTMPLAYYNATNQLISITGLFLRYVPARSNFIASPIPTDFSEGIKYAKYFQYLDTKTDDGVPTSGGFRASCCTGNEEANSTCDITALVTDYQVVINNKRRCDRFFSRIK